MKTKLSNILGVSLALMMVFGLAFALVPAREAEAQAYTPNQWNTMTTFPAGPAWKLLSGGNIPDFAVAADGKTIYALDSANAGAVVTGAATWLFKSANGGTIWDGITTLAGAANFLGPPKLVAVAPDDPNCVAVVASSSAVATGDDAVFYSINGGAVWTYMGDVRTNGTATGTENITDIAISPARSGPLMGRDLLVSTADSAVDTFGDIYAISGAATWTSVAVGAQTPLLYFDYTSLALAPGWAGDRVVVAVGSDNNTPTVLYTPGPNSAGAAGDTYLVMINAARLDIGQPPTLVAPFPWPIETSITDSPPEVGSGMTSSSVVLPSDFDSTLPVTQVAFVGWTSTTPTSWWDDAYRINSNTVRKLEIRTQVSIYSLAYSGTTTGGTLYAGETIGAAAPANALVWCATDPTVAMPSWSYSYKPPTGNLGTANANVVVAVTSDGTVYAATTGADSAFSRSNNNGVSFNQIGLIDENRTNLQDVMMTPDGSEVFLASSDAAGNYSLWWSKTKPTGASWERVRFKPTAGVYPFGNSANNTIIRLSPYYLDDGTLYWCDQGANTLGIIERSVDGGDIFGTKQTNGLPIQDLAVESKDLIYFGRQGTNLVYRSTNGGSFFELPAPAALGVTYSMAMCPTYPEKPVAGNLLVGGLGAAGSGVCLSLDGAKSFIPLAARVFNGNMQVLGDKDYATNKTVYAASSTATEGIYRYQFGVSSAWEQIRAFVAGSVATGLAMANGDLYSSFAAATAGAGAVAGDAFTIVATGADNVTIQVVAGSLTHTQSGVTGTAATVTSLVPGTIYVATFAAAGDYISFTAATANTFGTYQLIVGTPGISVTFDADGDATAGGNAFSLPDAAAAAGAAAVASGAWRTLVPTIPVITALTFDAMDIGGALTNFNVAPSALRAATCDAATTVWAINTAASGKGTALLPEGALMAYDDTMAKAKLDLTVPAVVGFDPSTGMSAEFVISWNLISNATRYNVGIYTDPGCTQLSWAATAPYAPPQPLAPTATVPAGTLPSGVDYYVRVFIVDQTPTDAIRSPFAPAETNVTKFTVAAGVPISAPGVGPVLLGPTPGATDVDAAAVIFSWGTMPNASEYEFILATDAALTNTLAGTPAYVTTPSFGPVTLDAGESYFYAVKVTKPVASAQSVGSFTTAEVVSVWTDPATGLTYPTREALEAAIAARKAPSTPMYIWIVIVIGAILVIAVIWLIFTTRKT